jgi:hypothetical protein
VRLCLKKAQINKKLNFKMGKGLEENKHMERLSMPLPLGNNNQIHKETPLHTFYYGYNQKQNQASARCCIQTPVLPKSKTNKQKPQKISAGADMGKLEPLCISGM